MTHMESRLCGHSNWQTDCVGILIGELIAWTFYLTPGFQGWVSGHMSFTCSDLWDTTSTEKGKVMASGLYCNHCYCCSQSYPSFQSGFLTFCGEHCVFKSLDGGGPEVPPESNLEFARHIFQLRDQKWPNSTLSFLGVLICFEHFPTIQCGSQINDSLAPKVLEQNGLYGNGTDLQTVPFLNGRVPKGGFLWWWEWPNQKLHKFDR